MKKKILITLMFMILPFLIISVNAYDVGYYDMFDSEDTTLSVEYDGVNEYYYVKMDWQGDILDLVNDTSTLGWYILINRGVYADDELDNDLYNIKIGVSDLGTYLFDGNLPMTNDERERSYVISIGYGEFEYYDQTYEDLPFSDDDDYMNMTYDGDNINRIIIEYPLDVEYGSITDTSAYLNLWKSYHRAEVVDDMREDRLNSVGFLYSIYDILYSVDDETYEPFAPVSPVREGYSFNNWYDLNGNIFEFSTTGIENYFDNTDNTFISVYANYELDTGGSGTYFETGDTTAPEFLINYLEGLGLNNDFGYMLFFLLLNFMALVLVIFVKGNYIIFFIISFILALVFSIYGLFPVYIMFILFTSYLLLLFSKRSERYE